jgi:hypothetical protein
MRDDPKHTPRGRNDLSGLRPADDFPPRDQARFRGEPARVEMQAVRVLDDGAGELDDATGESCDFGL